MVDLKVSYTFIYVFGSIVYNKHDSPLKIYSREIKSKHSKIS